MVARNALFLLCAVPLAALARWWLLAEGLARSDIAGALAPAVAIAAGLVLARLIGDRLGIPRR
jgi:hypothetical protein